MNNPDTNWLTWMPDLGAFWYVWPVLMIYLDVRILLSDISDTLIQHTKRYQACMKPSLEENIYGVDHRFRPELVDDEDGLW